MQDLNIVDEKKRNWKMNSSNLIKRKILVENQIVNKIFVQKFKLYFPRVNSAKKMILLMIELIHF